MTEEKALVQQESSALDVYGSGGDIKTLAERIKLCLPGGSNLKGPEALGLAQLSVAYGLNPFNGEVWYIPGRGPMVGIKGHRKAARKQADYWTEFVLLPPAEREGLDIPDNAVAYKCLIYRTDMIRQSAEAIQMMHAAGMKDAADRYAYRPTVGIGYATPGEASKMKTDQRARKRAEAEALKVAFDLPFASETGNGERVGYVDAEWDLVELPGDKALPVEPESRGRTKLFKGDASRQPGRVSEGTDPPTHGRLFYGDPDFEGFGGVTNTPALTPDEQADPLPRQDIGLLGRETLDYIAALDPEADGPDALDLEMADDPDLPISPKALLERLNSETAGYYNAAAHILQALRKVTGVDGLGWPRPEDRGKWAEYYSLALDHARASIASRAAEEVSSD